MWEYEMDWPSQMPEYGSTVMNLWKSEEMLERGSGGRRATTVLVRSMEGLQVSCNMVHKA